MLSSWYFFIPQGDKATLITTKEQRIWQSSKNKRKIFITIVYTQLKIYIASSQQLIWRIAKQIKTEILFTYGIILKIQDQVFENLPSFDGTDVSYFN